MTKRERVEAVYRLERPDRIPFLPAIYEHKARLIRKTPSEVCRYATLLYQALIKEVEIYDPDMLAVGIDVYNVEAEALGCPVRYFEDSSDVPAIAAPLIRDREDVKTLRPPDPETAGRMPMFVEVAGCIQRELGAGMIVRGAVTGPFSLASELLGAERFLIAAMEDREFAQEVLEFSGEVTISYATAFLRRGVQPIIFDSRATPKLSSPRIFRQMIVPVYRDRVIPQLKSNGALYLPLIIGGDTSNVVDDLIESGATQLLCDFQADLSRFKERCLTRRVPFRANIDPRLLHSGPREAIRASALKVLDEAGNHPGFLLGSGVVAYDTDPANVLEIRAAIESFARTPLK